MSDRLLALVICFAVLSTCVLGALVTASVQMRACESMCGAAGVHDFTLTEKRMDATEPGCHCAREAPR